MAQTSNVAAPAAERGPTRPGLTLNSTLAFVAAALVNSLLHEGAHAVAGLAYGYHPTINSFSVDADITDPTQEIVVALAGPLFSLVMGLVLSVVARNWGSGIVRLFFMWLWAFGLMNFVGYCVIAPFARGGDTGQALGLLGAPGWVVLAVCALGIAGQFLLARRFAVEVKRYAANISQERQLAFLPWIAGTVVFMLITVVNVTIADVPAIYLVPVLAYSVAVGVFAPMQFIFGGKVSNRFEDLRLVPVNIVAIVVTAVLVIFSVVLVAVGGIRL